MSRRIRTSGSRSAASSPARGNEVVTNGLRRGPDHQTGRSLATDHPRALDISKGEDQRRLRACFEERLDTSNRIILGEEEVDGVRLEERSVTAYERQKLLAHPGPITIGRTNNLRRAAETSREN